MNRPVAGRAVLLTTIVTALAAAASVFALVLGHVPVALGIACGAVIAILCGVSWIVGALATFDGSMNRLLGATLGAGPLRFIFALGAVCTLAVVARGVVDMVSLGCAFVVAHLLFQLIEAHVFLLLTEASSRYPKAKPIKFGGMKW